MGICPSRVAFAAVVFAKGGTTSLKAFAAFHGEGRQDGRLVGAGAANGLSVNLRVRNQSNHTIVVHAQARRCANLTDWNRRFRFAVVRHPLDRVVSAFHDKVEVERCIYIPFRRFCALPVAQRWPAFVRNVTTGTFRDGHVAPQVPALSKIGSLRLQAIVHLEEMEATWPWILERSHFQGPPSGHLFMHANNKKRSKSNLTAAYLSNPRELARLLQYYRDDLRALRYRAADVVDASVLAAATRLQHAKWASHEWSRGGNSSLAFVHLVRLGAETVKERDVERG